MQFVELTRKDGNSGIPISPVGFHEKLGSLILNAFIVDTLQVNVGKLCNQACKHCHVDAGPTRTEIMSRETIEQCLRVLQNHKIPILDITGGAPELIPDFRWFV